MKAAQVIAATQSSGLTVAELVEHQGSVNKPPLEGLLKHLKYYGPDGIMDAATHLTEDEQQILRKACKSWDKAHKGRKNRR